MNLMIIFQKTPSLLHRPLFNKLFTPAEPSLFPTTKHIISPATITRENFFSRASRFSDWGGSHSYLPDELTRYFDF